MLLQRLSKWAIWLLILTAWATTLHHSPHPVLLIPLLTNLVILINSVFRYLEIESESWCPQGVRSEGGGKVDARAGASPAPTIDRAWQADSAAYSRGVPLRSHSPWLPSMSLR